MSKPLKYHLHRFNKACSIVFDAFYRYGGHYLCILQLMMIPLLFRPWECPLAATIQLQLLDSICTPSSWRFTEPKLKTLKYMKTLTFLLPSIFNFRSWHFSAGANRHLFLCWRSSLETWRKASFKYSSTGTATRLNGAAKQLMSFVLYVWKVATNGLYLAGSFLCLSCDPSPHHLNSQTAQ